MKTFHRGLFFFLLPPSLKIAEADYLFTALIFSSGFSQAFVNSNLSRNVSNCGMFTREELETGHFSALFLLQL